MSLFSLTFVPISEMLGLACMILLIDFFVLMLRKAHIVC